MDRKMEEISQQNKNLERKIDQLLGAQANCSTGRRRRTRVRQVQQTKKTF